MQLHAHTQPSYLYKDKERDDNHELLVKLLETLNRIQWPKDKKLNDTEQPINLDKDHEEHLITNREYQEEQRFVVEELKEMQENLTAMVAFLQTSQGIALFYDVIRPVRQKHDSFRSSNCEHL